jgi:phosphoribosylanthranilate isomerase
MVKIKICGIRRLEDIEIVNKYLPEYIGFIFVSESKRYITPLEAKKMIEKLDSRIKRVGVFANEDAEMVNDISDACGLDIVQLHGDESPVYCEMIKKDVWKAIRVKSKESIEIIKNYNVDVFLFDSFKEGIYGGTGQKFDWEILKDVSSKYKIILAGGINIDNVKNAIEYVKPFCIDVSSSVETSGYKDEKKIRNIIEKVRGME